MNLSVRRQWKNSCPAKMACASASIRRRHPDLGHRRRDAKEDEYFSTSCRLLLPDPVIQGISFAAKAVTAQPVWLIKSIYQKSIRPPRPQSSGFFSFWEFDSSMRTLFYHPSASAGCFLKEHIFAVRSRQPQNLPGYPFWRDFLLLCLASLKTSMVVHSIVGGVTG